MVFALIALVLGFFIPHWARRFAKFMPASPAASVLYLFYSRKKLKNPSACEKFVVLRRKYRWRGVLYALAACGLVDLALWQSGSQHMGWYLTFILLSLLLAEVDCRYKVLPDVITFPLLILGFGFAVSTHVLMPEESFFGALVGYFLPLAASLPFALKKPDALGGGDVKFLAVIGAWCGVSDLLYVIILSCVLFLIYALISKNKFGAYGPALAAAAIVMLLF